MILLLLQHPIIHMCALCCWPVSVVAPLAAIQMPIWCFWCSLWQLPETAAAPYQHGISIQVHTHTRRRIVMRQKCSPICPCRVSKFPTETRDVSNMCMNGARGTISTTGHNVIEQLSNAGIQSKNLLLDWETGLRNEFRAVSEMFFTWSFRAWRSFSSNSSRDFVSKSDS